jgi:predicted nucleic acid-binding protein
MKGTFCAFLDASVLYPASLRNLLMRLTLNGLFQARWSAQVHEEWIRALLRDRPELPRERLLQVRDAMNEHAQDCIVTGYEAVMDGLDLPDANDRHVLAAAIVGHADVIVTHNLRHFPAAALDRFGIEAQHPDEFVRHLLDLSPVLVVDAVRGQQAALSRPPISMPALLTLFERLGLTATAAELRRVMVI